MKSGLRVGLVGAGWPTWQHIKAYKKVEDVEVAALCDSDPERLEAIADEYEVPERYASYETMLKKASLDVVSVCTPNFLHKEMTVKALEAGKHVLCEKPIAVTPGEAREMQKVSKKTKKLLMPAHMMRFDPTLSTLKAFIDGGDLGEIYFIRGWWIRRSGIPGMGGWFTQRDKSGGGVLIDLGVHLLDLILWFMDFPAPRALTSSFGDPFARRGRGAMSYGGHTQYGEERCDVEDYVVAHVTFEGGASLFMQCSWASHIASYDQGLEVWGEEGGARLVPDDKDLIIFTERKGVPVNVSPQLPDLNPFDEEIRHFIECIREGTKPLCDTREAVMTLELIEKIYNHKS